MRLAFADWIRLQEGHMRKKMATGSPGAAAVASGGVTGTATPSAPAATTGDSEGSDTDNGSGGTDTSSIASKPFGLLRSKCKKGDKCKTI